MDRYANLIAARLRRLALARSTGMLPFSDPCEGAIYFSDGGVAYAESARTPGAAVVPEVAGQPEPPPMPAKPRHATAAGPLSWGELLRILAITEATTDACLVLLTGEARYTRFRSTGISASCAAHSIPLADLLAEVARRQRLLRQFSAVLTADTPLTRTPHLAVRSIRVSALQWALLIRVRGETTPRELAWDLRRSVFATTVEVYRLTLLGLLTPAGTPATAPAGAPAPSQIPARSLMSFIRAVTSEKGQEMPAPRAVTGDVR